MKYLDKLIIRSAIILIIMCVLLIYFEFYLYPKTAIGNPICKEMSSQGYYETEWDTAGYIDCKIVYDSKWNPYKTNQTCMEERLKIDEKNLSNYGLHCVWGSLGYLAYVLFIMLPCIFMGSVVTVIAFIYTEYKKLMKEA